MKRIFTLLLLTFSISQLSAKTDSSYHCNWKSKVNDFNVWTNCDSNRTNTYLIGRFILNKNYTCTKGKRWKWTINNSAVVYSSNLYYKITQNGTYNVCLSLYDSCNKCDTSFCKSVTVTCISGCNWKSKVNDFNVWTNCDSTRTSTYLIGRFILNNHYTCSKGKIRKWSVNNSVVSTSQNLYYKLSQNGTYTVCLSLYDSCNKCDTSFCKTVVVSCMSKCNLPKGWSQSNSCATYSFDGYKVEDNNTIYTNPCHKYSWDFGDKSTANGKEVQHTYSKNGTYTVCMRVVDTCLKCDTMICKSITITCLTSCNWKSKVNDFNVWTNCDSTRNHTYLIGRFILNNHYTCSKGKIRRWTVNNSVVSTSQNLYYQISQNGTYTVCLSLYDSCNKCDTSFCKTVVVSCIGKCNLPKGWSQSNACATYSFNGYKVEDNNTIYTNPCHKYSWDFGDKSSANGKEVQHTYSKNGTYTVCMRVVDTCLKCDTTICKTITITCLVSCNWKSKVNDFNVWTNCDSTRNHTYLIGRFILNKNYTCTKGKKWKWMVNSTVVSYSQNLYYPITQNGTYNVCLYLYDSCKACDTTFCKSVTVNCIAKCNWKNTINDFMVKTNCDSNLNSVNIIGKFTLNQNYKCTMKLYRRWSVNNTIVGYGEKLYYKIHKNGMYNVCVTVYDSCKKCDTTYCRIIPVNCNRLGVEDNESLIGPSIYPNPAGDFFTVQGLSENISDLEIRVLDYCGKSIQVMSSMNAEGLRIESADLPSGVYMVLIRQGNQTWYLKLIKE